MSETDPTQLESDAYDVVARARRLVTRVERIKRWGIVYIAVLMTALVPIVSWAAITGHATLDTVRSVQQTNQAKLQATKNEARNAARSAVNSARLLGIIEDCLNPKGECAARSRAASAGVVGSINEVQLYVAACSPPPVPALTPKERYAIINPCVTKLLKENR